MGRCTRMIIMAMAIFLGLAGRAPATTYYIAANGSDSNSGTSKTSPWLHAPGMAACAGTCASARPSAGDSVILRGGDTWHFGNSSASPYAGSQTWNFSHNGSSGNPIYIGVDQTWYNSSTCGSSFCDPILNGDNPLWDGSSGVPSSCTQDFGGNSIVELGTYDTFDHFNVMGICTSFSGTGNPGAIAPSANDVISYLYYHGWMITTGSNNLYGPVTDESSSDTGIILDHDAFDGSDSPHYPAGNANCRATSNWPCTTGGGVYDRAYIIRYCVFRYMANQAVTLDTVSAHDNLFEYMEWPLNSTQVNAQHPDNLMVYSGTMQSFYNNVVRHNYVTQLLYFNVNSGAKLYIFNNIFYDNLRYDNTGDAAPTNCINLAAQDSGGNETLYVYNNTFDMDSDDSTGGGCAIGIYGTTNGNSEGFTWSGNVYAANNHLIGYSNLASLFTVRTSGASYTLNDNGGNLIQATATARSQGYSQSTMPVGDGPVNGSGSTIGYGTNESSSCSTFSSDLALCSGTTGAASETVGVLTFSTIAINLRPPSGAWNAGAYEVSSGVVSGAPIAPSGLVAQVQ